MEWRGLGGISKGQSEEGTTQTPIRLPQSQAVAFTGHISFLTNHVPWFGPAEDIYNHSKDPVLRCLNGPPTPTHAAQHGGRLWAQEIISHHRSPCLRYNKKAYIELARNSLGSASKKQGFPHVHASDMERTCWIIIESSESSTGGKHPDEESVVVLMS